CVYFFFFFSSRRRHTRSYGDWSSDVCSSDLARRRPAIAQVEIAAHQDGCPDGGEISGAHGIPGDLDPFRLGERAAVDLADDVNQIILIIHGTDDGYAGGLNAWQDGGLVEDRTIKSARPLLWITRELGVDGEHENVVAFVADVNAPEIFEGA